MSEPKQMTKQDAARIQSASDRSGRNRDFKGRAQSAGDRNQNSGRTGQSTPKK